MVLSRLPPRWRNLVIRLIMGSLMISLLSLLVYVGHFALVLFLLFVQLAGFYEITTIGYNASKLNHEVPLFRTLSWFFLFTSNFFLFGEGLTDDLMAPLLHQYKWLQLVMRYHRFISFSLCITGIITFVMGLSKRHYLHQFSLLGWTCVAIVTIVFSTQLAMRNVLQGIIWFLLPCAMTTCNDIMSYFFGFFIGKTPLIQLSPKKTWEGFIGGGMSTVIICMVLGHLLVQFDSLVCPVFYSNGCLRNEVFLPTYLNITQEVSIPWYSFHYHSAIIALFSALVGPFGGFFASGFKRAFNIKDFSDLIPGHGGIMDRIDCQIIMVVFIYVYHHTFIRLNSVEEVLKQVQSFSDYEQLTFFNTIHKHLVKRDLLK